ncbi:MAG: hypothetical protein WDN25_05195 [Acetobacteraceae bacterium]
MRARQSGGMSSPLMRSELAMPQAIGPYSVEERLIDAGTKWIAIRARGAEWSWLTPDEAVRLGRQWIARFGGTDEIPSAGNDDDLRPALQAAE